MKTGRDFREAFPQMDDGFRNAVLHGLANTEKEREPMKKKIGIGAVLIAAIVMMAAVGVAAVAGRWGLLDMVDVEGLNIQPEETQHVIMNDVAQRTDENEYASIVIREAVFDGIYAYIVADITPKEPNVLMVPERLDPETHHIYMLDNRISEKVTIAQWAKDHGYERLLLFNGVGGISCRINGDGSVTLLEVRNSEPRMPKDFTLKEMYRGEMQASLRWYQEPLMPSRDLKASFAVPNSCETVRVTTSTNESDFGGLLNRMVRLEIIQTDFTDYVLLRSTGGDFDFEVGEGRHCQYLAQLLDADGYRMPSGAASMHYIGTNEMVNTVKIDEVPGTLSVELEAMLYEEIQIRDRIFQMKELSRESQVAVFQMGEEQIFHFDQKEITQRSELDTYLGPQIARLRKPVVFEDAGVTLDTLCVTSLVWETNYELNYSVQPAQSGRKDPVYKTVRFDFLDSDGRVISAPRGGAKGVLEISTIPDTLQVVLNVFDASGKTEYGPVTVHLTKE